MTLAAVAIQPPQPESRVPLDDASIGTETGPGILPPKIYYQSLVDLIRLPAALLGPTGTLLSINPPMKAMCELSICVRQVEQNLYIRQNQWRVFVPQEVEPICSPYKKIRIHSLWLGEYRMAERQLTDQAVVSSRLTIVYAIGPSPVAMPSFSTLRSLFGLTRCEAKVALLLLQGLCVKRIARDTQRSEYTIREHLNSVLKKTQTCGQTNLVCLLSSLPT